MCIVGWIFDFIDAHNGLVSAIATVFIAAFTYVLIRVSSRQAELTRALVNAAEDTPKRQLRAYVNVKSGSLKNVTEGGHPTSTITIKNFGQTPAYRLIINCAIGLGESFDKLGPVTGKIMDKPIGTLAPGAKIEHFYPSEHVLTTEDMEGLKSGKFALFVHGEIVYWDFTGEKRTTKFRTFKNVVVGLGTPHLASCEEGNESD
jgi:hypothetical protein